MEYNDKVEIDIADLLKHLTRYWYIFIITILIGGLLGGGYALHKNTIIDNQTLEMKISEATEHLTPKEINEVNDISAKIAFAKNKITELSADMNSTNYSGDALEDAIKRVDYWNSIYNQQRTLSLTLPKESKAYYDVITADPDKEPEHESIIKYALFGGFAFFFLAFFICCGKYVFTPTIKTPRDLSLMYKYPILMNQTSKDLKESMLVTDISILMAKASLSKLGVLCDSSDKSETDSASKIVQALMDLSDNISASIIDPLSSPEELKKLSECDSVVSIITIHKSLRSNLFESLSYSDRYGCSILGFIAINKNS